MVQAPQFAIVTRFLNKQFKLIEHVYLLDEGVTRRKADKLAERMLADTPADMRGSLVVSVHKVGLVNPDGTRRS